MASLLQTFACILLWLSFLLGASVWAQPRSERAWTCQLIADIFEGERQRFREERGDVLGISQTFRETRSEWLPSLNERSGYASTWLVELQERSGLSATQFTYLLRRAAAQNTESTAVECSMVDGPWVAPHDAYALFRERVAMRQVRGTLPPDHPEFLPPVQQTTCGMVGEDAPSLQLVYLSRPVFDEWGRVAVAEDQSGLNMFRFENGRWQSIGHVFPRPC